MRFQISPDSEAFSNVSVSENEGHRFRSLQCGREVKTYNENALVWLKPNNDDVTQIDWLNTNFNGYSISSNLIGSVVTGYQLIF